MKYLKSFLMIIIFSFILINIYAGPTATAEVSLDTSKVEYFECGFTAEENPQHPMWSQAQGVSTYAIGTGGITPAGNIEILTNKSGGHLEIKSNVYTIWVFKIGLKNVQVTLDANPLKLKNIYIPYDLYIDKNDPTNLNTTKISVINKTEQYIIPTTEMDGKFIDFWITKFMFRVPGLPNNVESGTYKGSLTLTVTSM